MSTFLTILRTCLPENLDIILSDKQAELVKATLQNLIEAVTEQRKEVRLSINQLQKATLEDHRLSSSESTKNQCTPNTFQGMSGCPLPSYPSNPSPPTPPESSLSNTNKPTSSPPIKTYATGANRSTEADHARFDLIPQVRHRLLQRNPNMSLKIEVGKRYLRREGDVVLCIYTDRKGNYPIVCVSDDDEQIISTYTLEGFSSCLGASPSSDDIVKEYVESSRATVYLYLTPKNAIRVSGDALNYQDILDLGYVASAKVTLTEGHFHENTPSEKA